MFHERQFTYNVRSLYIYRPVGMEDTLPLDVTGLWADADGGHIFIETTGNYISALEYPHARTWGTVKVPSLVSLWICSLFLVISNSFVYNIYNFLISIHMHTYLYEFLSTNTSRAI